MDFGCGSLVRLRSFLFRFLSFSRSIRRISLWRVGLKDRRDPHPEVARPSISRTKLECRRASHSKPALMRTCAHSVAHNSLVFGTGSRSRAQRLPLIGEPPGQSPQRRTLSYPHRLGSAARATRTRRPPSQRQCQRHLPFAACRVPSVGAPRFVNTGLF